MESTGFPFFDIFQANLEYISKAYTLTFPPKPEWATANDVVLDLKTVRLREFNPLKPYEVHDGSIPVLIDAPFAGHSSTIADYADGQSLVQTYMANGATRVYVTDWKSATQETKNLDVDDYLEDLVCMINHLGGRVHLVGLCQGGWLSAMVAGLCPDKVVSLVLAGSPIDTDAGEGPILKMAHETPLSDFESLVKMGNGLMLGRFMLLAWKGMHWEQHYITKYFELYQRILKHEYDAIETSEHFARWYENPIDLPGKNFYLKIVDQLFKRNMLFKGEFVGLGRTIALQDIKCPVYLLAGAKDDITSPEQVFNAKQVLTGAANITEALSPGGHIGLFMGKGTLKNFWPEIVQWAVSKKAR